MFDGSQTRPIPYPTCECSARDFDPPLPAAFHSPKTKRFRLRTLIPLPIYSISSLLLIPHFPFKSIAPLLHTRNRELGFVPAIRFSKWKGRLGDALCVSSFGDQCVLQMVVDALSF